MSRNRPAPQAKRGPADNAPAAAPDTVAADDSIAGGVQDDAALDVDTVTGADGNETVAGADGQDSITGAATDSVQVDQKTVVNVDAMPAPAAYVAASATVQGAADTVVGLAEGETVLVNVPKAYRLTLNNYAVVQIAAGVQRLPIAHAEHPWSKAHGVTVINPDAVAQK